jgi:hypothetical protein
MDGQCADCSMILSVPLTISLFSSQDERHMGDDERRLWRGKLVSVATAIKKKLLLAAALKIFLKPH